MNYKMVDFSTWPRGDLFRFYMDHMRVVMSLTVDMNVTPLVQFVKKNNMKFYIKFIKPKQGAKVSADPDDYEFEDEEYENEDVPEQGEQEDQN